MRYAKAQLLAEMPTKRVTNEDLDLLDELTDRLRHYKGQHLGGYEVMNIGDPIAGRQMVMRMKPELIDGPISEKYAENWLIRATPGQLRQAVEDGTQRMASIDFGWAPEGMRVESPLAEMSYDAPRSPKNRQRHASRICPASCGQRCLNCWIAWA